MFTLNLPGCWESDYGRRLHGIRRRLTQGKGLVIFWLNYSNKIKILNGSSFWLLGGQFLESV
ncbi:MAG TPA: hypothetical protein DCQ51_07340 [Planktothrix sp. UBA8407]|nr:hypothetical protein [Planktothrix sp. UBA8402]HAO10975.1 hypothetical protein [Planktothrix sp. UBA8407]